jgi:hypothetical protein
MAGGLSHRRRLHTNSPISRVVALRTAKIVDEIDHKLASPTILVTTEYSIFGFQMKEGARTS